MVKKTKNPTLSSIHRVQMVTFLEKRTRNVILLFELAVARPGSTMRSPGASWTVLLQTAREADVSEHTKKKNKNIP